MGVWLWPPLRQQLLSLGLQITMTINFGEEEEVAEELVAESFEARQKEAQKRRKKKKKTDRTLVASTFADLYKLTGETLGEGSYGKVETCVNIYTGLEYAVKVIEKRPGFYCRPKVLKEIEIYHLCRGQHNNIQLIEYFEETERFCLVFEKINGGPLLDHIQARICFTEAEASSIIADLSHALKYLHNKGIAHRDIKPDNILCVNSSAPSPVKLCDFDPCSEASIDISTPTLLTPVGSVEYMAPEVVDTFLIDDYDDDDDESICYNKKCDLWSLGVIMYILLCGYAPFSGNCGLDCGWDRGESCTDCQERLFSSIKGARLDANQVLDHPWVLYGGNSNSLMAPTILRRQTSIKDLEDFASRAMAVNRAVGANSMERMEPVQVKRAAFSFDLSPPNLSNCGLMARRRRSKENFQRFCSIDEVEPDAFMRTIH